MPSPSLESSDPVRSDSSSVAAKNTQQKSHPYSKTSILRQTVSALSTSGSHQIDHVTRGRKILRFTQAITDSATFAIDEDGNNACFPDKALEEGRLGKKGLPYDQRNFLSSEPGTPNFSEAADQIRRTLSLASLDSLILLSANHAERTRFFAEVSRAGRDLVWRKESERRLLPSNNERAALLALKRGLRSFILAFSVRSGINILLLLFRLLRRRKSKTTLRLLIYTVFALDSWRFGGMMGTFTFLYIFTLHILRLAPPLTYYKRRLKHGLWNRATFGPPEREGAEGERRWQAAVAGAVGSLGLLFESKSRRTGVAQQYVSLLSSYTPRMGLHIPYGDLIVFGACCGQIMFAFLMSPETIPKEYYSWIRSASRVPEFAIQANRSLVRNNIIDENMAQKALDYKLITPSNRRQLKVVLQQIRDGAKLTSVPCEMVHPWCNSCLETNFRRFFAVYRFMLPVYSALHLIPMLVLRRHHFKRDPLGMLRRAGWGITRSCSFLGMFVTIYQTLFCARVQILQHQHGTQKLRDLLKKKQVFWAMGFTTCLSLLLEEKKRRAELAMYVLPKALESAWSSAKRRAWVPIVPFGEAVLGMAAMGMVMDAYKHQPEAMSGFVRKLLFQLVGPV
ncbi:hypothetical protein L204_100191 [Cryptococcus depauperatus]